MAPNLQKFCGLIVKNALLPTAELQTVYRAWRAARPDERDNLNDFAKYLVNHSAVTAAQLEKLVSPPAAPAVAPPPEQEQYDVVLRPVGMRPTRRDAVVAIATVVVTSVLWAIAVLALRPR